MKNQPIPQASIGPVKSELPVVDFKYQKDMKPW
jgi:hypothetical protein